MPDGLSAAVVATTVALAAAAFGGAYALAHSDPADTPAVPRPPASIELADGPPAEQDRARALPRLAPAPAPRAPAVEPEVESEAETVDPVLPAAPVAPAPAPTPTPAPTPAPQPDPAPPTNFDDSG